MKICEIVVLESLKPIKIANDVCDETYEFLHNLLNLTGFEEYVVQERLRYGVSKNGLDIHKELGKDLYNLGNNYINSFLVVVNEFSRRTGLSEDYPLQIALLVFYNAIVDVKKFKKPVEPQIEFIFGKENISNKMWKYDKEVGALIFPFQTSKTRVLNWITDNWDLIVEESAHNFAPNTFIQRTHKNILIEEEIRLLKDEGKSYTEIVKIFKEKYPDEKWYPSKIKKIHADEKQRVELQKLLSKANNTRH